MSQTQTAQTSGGLAFLAMIATVLARFLLTLIAWNYGVVGAVHAFGGNVGGIDFGTAVGIVLVLGSIRSVLSPPQPAFVVERKAANG